MTSVLRRRGGGIDRTGEDIGDEDIGEEDDVEAEIGIMWPQTEERPEPQKVKRQGRDPPWSLHRSPVDILISSFWPPEL